MYNVFYNVLPIFLIALLGSVIKRKWLTSDEFWRGLEKLSFYILFPTAIFEYSSKIDLNSSEFIKLTTALISSTLIVSIMLVLYQTPKILSPKLNLSLKLNSSQPKLQII